MITPPHLRTQPRKFSACRAAPTAEAAPQHLENHDDVAIHEFPAILRASFTDDRSFFHEHLRIRGYEVRPDQTASIVTIANLLQVCGR